MTPNISSFRLFSLTFVAFLGLGLNSVSVQAQFDESHIRAVDQNAPGGPGDLGATWQNAYIYLQDALAYAAANPEIDEVWVATGTYYPDQDAGNPDGTGDRSATFLLDFNNIQLLGGFEGTETLPEQRDPVANLTVLSGDITNPWENCGPDSGNCFDVENGTPGCDDMCGEDPCPGCCALVCEIDPICCLAPWDLWDCADLATQYCSEGPVPFGAYHVVTAIGVDATTRIDGFIITAGAAVGTFNNARGGGMFIADSDVVVLRCAFTDNLASPILESAAGEGGGVNVAGESDPTFVNCLFLDNFADEGGGFHAEAENNGGFIGVSSATLINCLFVRNEAMKHGGAIDVGSKHPAELNVFNCTFVQNTAGDVGPGAGGGAFWIEDPEDPGDPGPTVLITNCILWDDFPNEIKTIGGTIIVRFTNIEGGVEPGWNDGDNINSAPIFGPGIDNFRLAGGSRGIDEGNNADVPCDAFDVDQNGEGCDPDPIQDTPDLDLGDRIVSGTVDMGAYESVPCPWDLDSNCKVGVGDLLIVLADWGNPYGIGDLLALLAAWGPCQCAPDAEPLTLEEELADACLTMDHWNAFVAVMSDPNASQEDKDRYNCWMTHYLDHCNKCTCEHLPECPSPDPFSST